ncbi:MAG TPA: hypothetical protein DCP32_02450 [Anaerolineaceae bacterium]|nr:MAG: hypothetical protein A2X24_04580 [Chloroflexi bacterium GWB2_54_36]HAL15638.1 hypothetical protein [Anaerolineaceae bacterium]HBA92609.1 hypothetical protein [Anaerolineaceae bacterium]
MENPTIGSGAPPRMMNAIIAGFNVVANNLALLVLPIVFDLYLWLGPQVSVQKVLKPMIDETVRLLQQINSPELAGQMTVISDIWDEILANFNLAGAIRTLPIGVPSLMSSVRSAATPLGPATLYEVPNLTMGFGIWLVVISIGFLAGSLYFSLLARATSDTRNGFELMSFLSKTGMALALTLGLLIGLIILLVPALMLVSVIALISPGMGDFALLFAGFLLIWMLLPLIFTPHAIFSLKFGLVASAMTSVRLVRHFLPGTGMFLIIALIIARGMDVLWQVPPASSWMTLVGILGHAFIYTAVFAASFVYFRGGIRWMVENSPSARPQEIKTEQTH